MYRGIFFDKFSHNFTEVLAECRLYNVEAQLYIEKYLAKRSRYYQAKKDSRALKREEIGYAKGEHAGFQKGVQSERFENFADLLRDLGEPPAAVLERAKALDKDTLKTWMKYAARAESMEEFLAQIEAFDN